MTGLAYEELTDDGRYNISAQCSTCGQELNTANGVPKKEWTSMLMSAPLNTRNCDNPECSHTPDYPDCNSHVTLIWSSDQTAKKEAKG